MRLHFYGLGILIVFRVMLAAGQDRTTPQQEEVRTLHVYMDLVQVPTLVLSRDRTLIKPPIAEKRFLISIDSGPWSQVAHARLEES